MTVATAHAWRPRPQDVECACERTVEGRRAPNNARRVLGGPNPRCDGLGDHHLWPLFAIVERSPYNLRRTEGASRGLALHHDGEYTHT